MVSGIWGISLLRQVLIELLPNDAAILDDQGICFDLGFYVFTESHVAGQGETLGFGFIP